MLIDSIVHFVTHPLIVEIADGVDIDYEFPGGGGVDPDRGAADDGANYVLFAQELRAALNQIKNPQGEVITLSCAIGIAPAKLAFVDWKAISDAMDHILMMIYDINGPTWSEVTGHNAPVTSPNKTEGLSVD